MRTKGIDVKNSCNITQEERNAFMERFKTVCRQRGTTVAAMQIKLGKANAYFRNMGYISEFIGEEIKEYIPDINIEYVNEGIGEPFISGIPRKKIEKEDKLIAQVKQVPLLSTAAHGGSLIGFDDANNIQCEMIMSPVSNADIALTVAGDSMSPEYPNGCRVFIRRINEAAFLDWGCTYVLDTINGVVIKNIFPMEGDESKVVCRSINPNYPDFAVSKTDVRGWYKVVLQMSMK